MLRRVHRVRTETSRLNLTFRDVVLQGKKETYLVIAFVGPVDCGQAVNVAGHSMFLSARVIHSSSSAHEAPVERVWRSRRFPTELGSFPRGYPLGRRQPVMVVHDAPLPRRMIFVSSVTCS